MFSAEEVVQIDELLSELDVERVALGEAGEYLFKKSRLCRFLQGNAGSIQAAAAQFRTMLQHRAEFGIERLRATIEGKPWAPESAPAVALFCKTMWCDIWESTPEGDILMVACDGLVNWDDVATITDDELYTVDNTMMELRQANLDTRSDEQQRVAKVVQVRDLSGLGLTQLLSNAMMMHRFQTILNTSLTSYPETMRTVIILNAPSTFGSAWSIVSPLLNERVQAKVKFLELDDLREIIGAAGLGALEILGRLRGRSTLDSIDVAAGEAAYGYKSIAEGESLEWAFTIAEMDIEFRLVFFPRDTSLVSEKVVAASRASGSIKGQFVADEAGLLWATWSNKYSWISGKSITTISGLSVW